MGMAVCLVHGVLIKVICKPFQSSPSTPFAARRDTHLHNSVYIVHRDAPLLNILVLHYVIGRVADDAALGGGQRMSQERSPCFPIRIHAASLLLRNTSTKVCNCLTSLRRRR